MRRDYRKYAANSDLVEGDLKLLPVPVPVPGPVRYSNVEKRGFQSARLEASSRHSMNSPRAQVCICGAKEDSSATTDDTCRLVSI